ncbi:MAG: response regulator receiver protein [Betaproteobacteria bacterium]|nr:response regulator receiver protein [Betaproteobacteria bacterium]
MTQRPAEILLVEDNEDEVFLTRRAFRTVNPLINLHHVDNGEKCLAFLRRQPPYEQAPVPDLVLLDINMPVMSGREVLQAINADDALCHLPVVVMTTSNEENEIFEMYRLRCSSYVTKPVNFERFVQVIRQLCDYWLSLASLPRK